MKKKYVSEALEVCHKSAKNLYELGVIDEDEMKEFDKDCFVSSPKASYGKRSQRQTSAPAFAAPR